MEGRGSCGARGGPSATVRNHFDAGSQVSRRQEANKGAWTNRSAFMSRAPGVPVVEIRNFGCHTAHLAGSASALKNRPNRPSDWASSVPWVPWACPHPSWENLELPSEAGPGAWLQPHPSPSRPATAPREAYSRLLRYSAGACFRLP